MFEWIRDNVMTSDFFFILGLLYAIVLAHICLFSYRRLSKFCKVLAWVHGLVLLTVAGIIIAVAEGPIRILWWIWFIFGWYCWLSVTVSLMLFIRARLKRKHIIIISP